jgi:hypothetical protein
MVFNRKLNPQDVQHDNVTSWCARGAIRWGYCGARARPPPTASMVPRHNLRDLIFQLHLARDEEIIHRDGKVGTADEFIGLLE